MPSRVMAAGALAAAVALTSCIHDPEIVTPVAIIRIDGGDEVDVGDTLRLSAIAFDSHGLAIPHVRFRWRSEFPEVATVGGSGLVTGLRGGTTEIVVTGGGTEARLNFVVNSVATSVTVTPPSVTIPLHALQQFDAAVRGTTSTAVVWSVAGVVGGNATVGTISASGIYSAPSAIPATNPIWVKAHLAADPQVADSALVTLVGPLSALRGR